MGLRVITMALPHHVPDLFVVHGVSAHYMCLGKCLLLSQMTSR